MDAASTIMTFTHLLIIWTLLGVLLVWLLLFAFLALRPDAEKMDKEVDELGYTTVFLHQTSPSVTHVAQSAIPSSINAQVYETGRKAAPLV
ncbi:MAG: hypothetical protein NVSMB54_24610 [Ktedonobacteraceae bacterium]